MDRGRARVVMDRLYELEPGAWTIQEFFTGWFKGADISLIKRGNALEFTAYGFFAAKFEDLPSDVQGEIEDYLHRLEKKHGHRFADGRNNDIEFMAHLWEPLRVMHKPLAMFLTSEVVSVLTDVSLFCMGFKLQRCQGFRYWVRKARGRKGSKNSTVTAEEPLPKLRSLASDVAADKGRKRSFSSQQQNHARPRTPVAGAQSGMDCWDSVSSLEHFDASSAHICSSAPIFFMHGVGLGLTPYLQFMANLIVNFRTRDIVMLECRHVSLNLCSHAISPDVVVEAIAEVLRRNRWKTAAFIGHSYGTFVLSRMVQLHRQAVESLVRARHLQPISAWPLELSQYSVKAQSWTPAYVRFCSMRMLASHGLDLVQAVMMRLALSSWDSRA
ncbi:hypothetical protein MMC29_000388 [Sticta canariensis]|nr:hypothetical protein [Sticta canariensis]